MTDQQETSILIPLADIQILLEEQEAIAADYEKNGLYEGETWNTKANTVRDTIADIQEWLDDYIEDNQL